jgi:RNA polymerase sigma factor (TIGR02999 family)
MNTHAPDDVKQPLSDDEDKLSRGEVTQLLLNWNKGDASALDRLIELVYDELTRMAHRYLRRKRVEHILQTGTLVDEVYLALYKANNVECRNRQEFFGIAARQMRHVLVEFARKYYALKRGGRLIQISLEDAAAVTPPINVDLIALHEALDELARYDKELSEVVELRYFAGYTIEETAEILGVGTDKVKQRWKKAKIHLLKIMTDAEGDSDGSATMEKN